MSEVGTVLQWNMGCPSARKAKQIEPAIILRRCEMVETMLDEHTPTFIVLQEAPPECVNRLRGKYANKYTVVDWHKGLVTLYSANWALVNSTIIRADRGVLTFLEQRKLGGARIRLWNVHLPSLMRTTERDREEAVRFFCESYIRKHRDPAASDSATELIAGDFNLIPGDIPVTVQGGLWANESLLEARRAEKRTKRDLDRKFYRPLFNPMWELHGRTAPPQGTYYRGGSKVGGPWYIFDQTIMSPVHGLTPDPHVTLIEKIKNQQLWSNAEIRRPDDEIGSDHYPVLVKFKLS